MKSILNYHIRTSEGEMILVKVGLTDPEGIFPTREIFGFFKRDGRPARRRVQLPGYDPGKRRDRPYHVHL
ncbi:MAG: hypothetical protein AB2L20_06735 [Mangrovibacterium sp.]